MAPFLLNPKQPLMPPLLRGGFNQPNLFSKMSAFSKRYGYSDREEEITIREDAPQALRSFLTELAYGTGCNEVDLHTVVCQTLRRRSSSLLWGTEDYHNESSRLLKSCPWFKIYDIIEKIYGASSEKEAFEEEINSYFALNGIGWKLENGLIMFRGTDTFETQLRQAEQVLANALLTTANTEIHEAINDLSRMPHADITGAIQHSLACLECVAREAAGGTKQTLGELIKSRRDLVPEPLNSAIEKIWGFSSNQGRNLQEGNAPSFEEAELLVGLSAALSTYLARKFKSNT